MDTWIVARKPIGMYKPPLAAIPSPTPSPEVFFLGARKQNTF
jgi:hypothetical protein